MPWRARPALECKDESNGMLVLEPVLSIVVGREQFNLRLSPLFCLLFFVAISGELSSVLRPVHGKHLRCAQRDRLT